MSHGSVLVVGSLNIDLVTQVQQMPRVGETMTGRQFDILMGGKGANQAVAAARLGAKTAMIGCVGNDVFGGNIVSALAEEGIRTDGIRRVEGVSSGTAVIVVDGKGDNFIVVSPGANGHLGLEDVEAHLDLFEACGAVVLQLEVPLETVIRSISAAKSFGKTVIFNPAPMRELPDGLLRDVDYLILNEVEAEQLTGISADRLEELAEKLIRLGCGHTVLTLGEKGAVYIHGNGLVRFPAYKVKAVDTTGAGDAFIGAFACRIAKGEDAEAAVRYAVKASAITVTKLGAQASLPTEEEVRQFSFGGSNDE